MPPSPSSTYDGWDGVEGPERIQVGGWVEGGKVERNKNMSGESENCQGSRHNNNKEVGEKRKKEKKKKKLTAKAALPVFSRNKRSIGASRCSCQHRKCSAVMCVSGSNWHEALSMRSVLNESGVVCTTKKSSRICTVRNSSQHK